MSTGRRWRSLSLAGLAVALRTAGRADPPGGDHPEERTVHAALHTASLAARPLRRG